MSIGTYVESGHIIDQNNISWRVPQKYRGQIDDGARVFFKGVYNRERGFFAATLVRPYDEETQLITSEAAEILDVHPNTIRRRGKKGILPSTLYQKGRRTYTLRNLNEYLEKPKQELTISEAAEILHIHPDTLKRWSNPNINIIPEQQSSGYRKYRRDDLDEYLGRVRVGGEDAAETRGSNQESQQLLTISEAAEFIGISVKSLRYWTDKRFIPTYRIGPRKDRMFALRDLEVFKS